MRKVATIPLRHASDLATTPYTDRVVRRHTSWRWKQGRTVFELVAPGGDVYVMQSYAQIVDPKLSLKKLRRLGPRLTLPQGWRYRARKLRHPFVLTTRAQATIVQDDLKNTYQLAHTVRRGKPTKHAVHVTGRTRTVKSGPGGVVEDRGTVTGAPFGKGTIVLDGTLADGHLTATFRIRYAHGSVLGATTMPIHDLRREDPLPRHLALHRRHGRLPRDHERSSGLAGRQHVRRPERPRGGQGHGAVRPGPGQAALARRTRTPGRRAARVAGFVDALLG